MGVSSTARLPSLGAQSIPQLFNHLQVSSNAKVASRWSITIRSFRAVPVPTNVWPVDNHATAKSSVAHASSSSSSSTGPAPLTKPRTMWQIWLSEYPGVVFIIVEDSGKASRAKVWRDWEDQKESWKARKPSQGASQAGTAQDGSSAMDIDVSEEGQPNTPHTEPELQVPSHTRYSVTAVTSSMSSMLTSLNLPPPHGAPVGTAGPGAWVPRGAAVSIEGLVLEISSQNMNGIGGLVGAASASDDSAGQANVDWRVRVGSVVGGGGKSAGAVVEAEFLPMSALAPSSTYLHNFLQSLVPASMLNIPAGSNGTFSSSGIQTNPQSVGQQAAAGTQNALTGSSVASNTSSFTYVIGSNAKLVDNTPNSTFNIPMISDQLWEEVVPTSAITWRNMILARSQRAALEQAKTNTKTGAGTDASPFEWHSFGSENGKVHSLNTEPVSDDALKQTVGPSTKQEKVNDNEDDDDDDDDDRPLGASYAKKPTQTVKPAAETSVHLTFEGLRSDSGEAGWIGIERGRRVAFHYVQMLRAEGII